MGTELIGDRWLQDMLMPGAQECKPASILLTCQILTFNHTGHLIALNDELPRRRITIAARHGGLPPIYVRCMRCGALARLNDWIKAAELVSAERVVRAATLRATRPSAQTSFLMPCEGNQQLVDSAPLLDIWGKDGEA